MIYYTSDLHFNHKNIIRFCHRPFWNVTEMNEEIMANWNSIVTPKDEVYILGDVIFNWDPSQPIYLDEMNGTKHLIIGNHDQKYLKEKRFTEQFASIDQYLVINDNGRKVVLFHYPIAEWDGYFRDWYHCYGHIHNADNVAANVMKTIPNAFNVGVDNNYYRPQTLDQLILRNNVRSNRDLK